MDGSQGLCRRGGSDARVADEGEAGRGDGTEAHGGDAGEATAGDGDDGATCGRDAGRRDAGDVRAPKVFVVVGGDVGAGTAGIGDTDVHGAEGVRRCDGGYLGGAVDDEAQRVRPAEADGGDAEQVGAADDDVVVATGGTGVRIETRDGWRQGVGEVVASAGGWAGAGRGDHGDIDGTRYCP